MFLQIAGLLQGIPYSCIRDHKFLEKLVKQVKAVTSFPVTNSSIPTLNLNNGTLHFTPNGIELKPFNKQDGLTYQLPYNHDPTATAPMFRKYLDRVLPDVGCQKLFFQYIAYILLPHLRLQKILFLLGEGDTGKGTLLEIIKGLFGEKQWCAFSLENITTSEYTRAAIGDCLLNVCTDIGKRLNIETFKILAARESLDARHPYGKPFTLNRYATPLFAMNNLPKDVEQSHAYFRRFMIIPFTQSKITAEEKIEGLADKIIAAEMPGVLNYIIEGVQSLLEEGKFDIPQAVADINMQFQTESCSVATFLEDNGYSPGFKNTMVANDFYKMYAGDNKYAVSKIKFNKRLKALGYDIKKLGKNNITMVWYNQDKTEALD